jgi:hypothetical protein
MYNSGAYICVGASPAFLNVGICCGSRSSKRNDICVHVIILYVEFETESWRLSEISV